MCEIAVWLWSKKGRGTVWTKGSFVERPMEMIIADCRARERLADDGLILQGLSRMLLISAF
jgi:hypothetical protein